MASVAINPPKTPVTKGSNGIAAATLPNVCKMPGPPAPFVPTPLPNIGKSGMGPKDYSTTVKIEGNAVAIKGASFGSMGDVASKGLGGGMVSMNCEGPTKFIGPGAMNVKIQGKNVQLLSDQMLNNCGPSGSPANSATMAGEVQAPNPAAVALLQQIAKDCDKKVAKTKNKKKKSCTKLGAEKHACCEEKIQAHRAANPEHGEPPVQGEQGYKRPELGQNNRPKRVNGKWPAPQPTGAPRPNVGAAIAQGGAAKRAAFAALKGNCYPDAAIINDNGSKTFVDFKFPCPKGHPSGKGKSKGGKKTAMGAVQKGSYDSLGRGSGNGDSITITP